VLHTLDRGERLRCLSPSKSRGQLPDLQTHDLGKDHGLSRVNDGAFQVHRSCYKAFHAGTAKVSSFEPGSFHVHILEFTSLQRSAAQVTAVKVSVSEVAGFKFARLKASKSKLRKCRISRSDHSVLAFGFDSAKTGKPAVYEFHSQCLQPDCFGIGEVTIHQPHVFQAESGQPASGEADSRQNATFKDN
jgi:hypothetical protein